MTVMSRNISIYPFSCPSYLTYPFPYFWKRHYYLRQRKASHTLNGIRQYAACTRLLWLESKGMWMWWWQRKRGHTPNKGKDSFSHSRVVLSLFCQHEISHITHHSPFPTTNRTLQDMHFYSWSRSPCPLWTITPSCMHLDKTIHI